ncbi:MAG TPA: prolyl-tRNA synthetase associated domain-containing protein [Mobilitalea sp.]|nr:prolyl-tRNA synthetase associated domain-containing protein [Mobilitalea sp.]
MSFTVYKGRPEDMAGRPDKEKRVYDLLDELGVEYIRVDHEPLETMEACRDAGEALEADICKNLFLCNSQKTKFYLLIMPGDKKFKTKDLSKQIGSARLSFGPQEDMERLLNISSGSVSVMGLMNDKDNHVRLLIDKEVVNKTYFACHPCINTSSIRFKTVDLLGKVLPAIGHEPTFVTL